MYDAQIREANTTALIFTLAQFSLGSLTLATAEAVPEARSGFVNVLPREIRDEIYKLCVVTSEPRVAIDEVVGVKEYSCIFEPFRHQTDPPSIGSPSNLLTLTQVPAITAVCKQVRKESLPIFFDVNVFHFNLFQSFDFLGMKLDEFAEQSWLQKWLPKIRNIEVRGLWHEGYLHSLTGAIAKLLRASPSVTFDVRLVPFEYIRDEMWTDGPFAIPLYERPEIVEIARVVETARSKGRKGSLGIPGFTYLMRDYFDIVPLWYLDQWQFSQDPISAERCPQPNHSLSDLAPVHIASVDWFFGFDPHDAPIPFSL